MRSILVFTVFIVSLSAQAAPVEWQLQDVYLEDGVQLVGSFVFDSEVSEGFQHVSIQAVKNSLVTDFQVPGFASVNYPQSSADYLLMGCGPECSINGLDEVYRLELEFASSLTNDGGIVSLSYANFLGAAPDFAYSYDFSLVSGSVVATVVPIPAAVWLFGSALAGLGWMRRRSTQ